MKLLLRYSGMITTLLKHYSYITQALLLQELFFLLALSSLAAKNWMKNTELYQTLYARCTVNQGN
jgi:hypothetical protein